MPKCCPYSFQVMPSGFQVTKCCMYFPSGGKWAPLSCGHKMCSVSASYLPALARKPFVAIEDLCVLKNCWDLLASGSVIGRHDYRKFLMLIAILFDPP